MNDTTPNEPLRSGRWLAALVAAQDEYIELLAGELSDVAAFLALHNINCSAEKIRRGRELREKIAALRSAANTQSSATPNNGH